MKLLRKVKVVDRAGLVALANEIVQDGNSRRWRGHGPHVVCPMAPPVTSWRRAAAIVRHHHPELADQVRAVCKHKAVV
ncbi:hypothetical protein [Euzebya sp.]|uniref:hypothetical protein n=1 Tax=Euzebya sp. TaxID=1971409 RepID=UPI00351191EF